MGAHQIGASANGEHPVKRVTQGAEQNKTNFAQSVVRALLDDELTSSDGQVSNNIGAAPMTYFKAPAHTAAPTETGLRVTSSRTCA